MHLFMCHGPPLAAQGLMDVRSHSTPRRKVFGAAMYAKARGKVKAVLFVSVVRERSCGHASTQMCGLGSGNVCAHALVSGCRLKKVKASSILRFCVQNSDRVGVHIET